jgi:hypothetical protein
MIAHISTLTITPWRVSVAQIFPSRTGGSYHTST